ncbi:helix-turn-helix transcriptional regulator [Gallibacterium salpingitidis]|uniref:helix-turn-helix transcriptional regulator n=1 Tax=Gallibacterium salpingitidis TaxID=505341 RepID=UPI0026708C2B|nr:helix-turn-helix transcriptional regulator [Gallibacterium salpingitidis]WKT00503.1 helix-turn-helix transcriptional regulator [Gallibacterium salpingitidis]
MNKIAKIRKELGVTQCALAEQLGWSQPRIANYELGTRTPTLVDIRRIVTVFKNLGANVTIDDVFPENGE